MSFILPTRSCGLWLYKLGSYFALAWVIIIWDISRFKSFFFKSKGSHLPWLIPVICFWVAFPLILFFSICTIIFSFVWKLNSIFTVVFSSNLLTLSLYWNYLQNTEYLIILPFEPLCFKIVRRAEWPQDLYNRGKNPLPYSVPSL